MFFLFTSDYKCIFSNKEVGQLYQVSESKTYLSPFTKRLAWERERERERVMVFNTTFNNIWVISWQHGDILLTLNVHSLKNALMVLWLVCLSRVWYIMDLSPVGSKKKRRLKLVYAASLQN